MVHQLILTLLLALQVCFAATKPNVSKNKSRYPINKQERKTANNFLQVYQLADKGVFNTKIIKAHYYQMKKSRLFRDYLPWSRNLYQMTHEASLEKLKKTCSNLKSIRHSEALKQALHKHSTETCFKLVLGKLSRRGKNSHSFHRNQLKYFKNNIQHFMAAESAIVSFLESMKNQTKFYKLYSNAISTYYILYKELPPSKITKVLHITPRLTRFLQQQEIENEKARYVPYRQLVSMKDAIEEELKTSKDRAKLKKDVTKLIEYFDQTYPFQMQDRASLRMLSIGKELTRVGHLAISRSVFAAILKVKNKEYEKQAIFEQLWTYILEDNYKQGYNHVISRYLTEAEDILDNSQLAFWTATTLDRTNRRDEANSLFKEIIKRNPLSYYSILSAKKLSRQSPLVANDIYLASIAPTHRSIAKTSPLSDQDWLSRLAIWSELDSSYFLSQELMTKRNHKNFDQYVLKAAEILSSHENYLDSFKVLIRSLNNNYISMSKKTLRLLFPTPYLDQIQRQAQKEFDPIIALSLIRQESGFDKRAKSRVGARGLMQLMPATARRFKRRLKNSHLYNPKLNISIGTKYFNGLLKRYDKNIVYSLAAYNAGEHRVDRWQNDFLSDDSILKNIENIPYRETRKYVKLIFRNIFFYKLLLNDGAKDKQKFNQIFDLYLGFNR